MKKLMLVAAIMSLSLPYNAALADGTKEGEKAAEVTITGEVVDLTCFLENGAKGPDHANCAKACIGGGLPVGLLEDKTEKVYLIINKDHKSANANFADKAGKKVKVTGHIKESKGVNLLVVSKVE